MKTSLLGVSGRWWRVGLFAVLVAVVVSAILGFLNKGELPQGPEETEKAGPPANKPASPPSEGDSIPERLNDAAHRVYDGFEIFPSRDQVPWDTVKEGKPWSESELTTLEALKVMLVEHGDELVVKALPGGQQAAVKQIRPLSREVGFQASGRTAVVNVLLSADGETLLVNRKVMQRAFAGSLYQLHRGLLHAAQLKREKKEGDATRIAEESNRRQLEFAKRLVAVLQQFPQPKERQMLLDELELLEPRAFAK